MRKIYRISIINKNSTWIGWVDSVSEELYHIVFMQSGNLVQVPELFNLLDQRFPGGYIIENIVIQELEDIKKMPKTISSRIFINENNQLYWKHRNARYYPPQENNNIQNFKYSEI